MASSTEICNIALSHLNIGKEIAALDTEQSQEASACRRFYETALDATLRDFAWPFSSKIDVLALIEEDPNDEWAFSYRYPSDCLKVKRILSGVRVDTRQSRIEYKISRDDAGLIIFCDIEDAEMEYSVREEDPEKYPSDFIMAFSYRLAAYIAPRLTKGDPFKLGDKSMSMYFNELSQARANALNEEQVPIEAEAEIIRARE
jgi:hypothetical protein